MEKLTRKIKLMKPLIKSSAICALLSFLGLSAVAWSSVHALRRQTASVMEESSAIPLDYFLETKSFSEIENTKALLVALAAQSISAMRSRSAVNRQVQTD